MDETKRRPSIMSRVRAGSQRATHKWPNWYWIVDPDTLDMRNPTRCIGGQLDGHYNRFLRVMGITYEEAAQLGFTAWFEGPSDVPFGEWKDEFPELNIAWQRAIRHLRDKSVMTELVRSAVQG